MHSRLFIFLVSIALLGCSQPPGPESSFEVAAIGAQNAALSDDGQYAFIGSVHHGGSLWRLRDGERLYNWNHKSGENSVVIAADFSPDGRYAMTADRHTLVLWNVETGQGERFWTAPGEVLSIALSENGDYALLGLSDFRAVLFRAKIGGIQRTFDHSNRVRSVSLSKNGRLALTGSEDYSAALWDVSSGKQLQLWQHNDDVQIVALSPNGKRAFTMAKYDTASLWDSQSGKKITDLKINSERLKRGLRYTSASFNETGKQLITGRPDRIVQLWDAKTGQAVKVWQLPKRDAWRPTQAAVLAAGFNRSGFSAIASNGFVHQLK